MIAAVNWSADQMIEVSLNEPDDLKVKETLTRIRYPEKRKDISILSHPS